MRMKKAMALLLSMVVATGALSGCGNSGEDASKQNSPDVQESSAADTTSVAGTTASDKEWYGTPDGKPVTLQFWAGIQPEYGYEDVINNFNEEYADKGVQVKYNRYVNDSDGNLQLETYLMAGDEGSVDVFIGYGSKIKLSDRASAGLLYDYSDYLDSIGFDVATELGQHAANNYIFEDGAVYGLPTKFDNDSYVMINTDMFKEAGVDIPYNGWTYDEFMDALAKLTHGEGQDKVYGMCWGFSTNKQWTTYISAVLGNKGTFKDETMKEVNWEDPVWVDGFNLVKDSCDKGYAPSLEDDLADSMSVSSMFLEGKCAIYGIFSQMRLAMDTEDYPHDFTTALVPFPVPSEDYADSYMQPDGNYSGDFICISSNCQYKEAACEFARWYIEGGMNPLIKAARYPQWLGNDVDAVLEVVKESAGDTVDIKSLENLLSLDRSSDEVTYTSSKSSELAQILWEEGQDFLYGVTPTAEEALHKATERGNLLLAEE